MLIRNTLTIAFMLAYLLWINWQLTLIAFAAGPLVGFVIRKISRRLKRVSVLVQERTGALTHALEEAIGAHRVVKVFGGEAYESGRLRYAADRLRLAAAKQASAAALGTPINQIIVSIAVGIIVWLAIRQAAGEPYRVGDFITFVFALLHLLNQLKTLTNVSGTIQRGLTAAESVFALIDEPAEIDRGTVTIDRARGAIRFERVTKQYVPGAPPALDGIDLDIAPGESVALVGPLRRGQDDARQSDSAVLHADQRPRAARRLRPGGDSSAGSAPADRARVAGDRTVQRYDRREHRLRRDGRRIARRRRACRRGGERA